MSEIGLSVVQLCAGPRAVAPARRLECIQRSNNPIRVVLRRQTIHQEMRPMADLVDVDDAGHDLGFRRRMRGGMNGASAAT